MSAKKRKIACICGLLVFCVIFCGIFHARQPRYEGKPLDYWLQTCLPEQETPDTEHQLDAVMKSVGTNSVPTLLFLLRAKDSKARSAWNKVLVWVQDNYAIQTVHLPAWERNYEGLLGFKRLGSSASNAVPDLIKIYDQDITSDSQSAALLSLGALGPTAQDAVPTLINHLILRSNAWDILDALGEIHSEADTVVPILTEHLSDTNVHCRTSAAKALGAYGGDAKPAIPLLTKRLQDENAMVRTSASNALMQIDSAALGPQTGRKLH